MSDQSGAQPESPRPSSGKATRLRQAQEGNAGDGLIGSGKALGSELTDTLSAELCYGVDGKTELTFRGKKYIFAPMTMEDHDEAAADIKRLPIVLLAFGICRPTTRTADITPADVAGMLRVISGAPEVTELSTCVNVTLLLFDLTEEHRAILVRLFWYCFRRFHEDLTVEEVARWIDYSNLLIIWRLWWRKNVGYLDRFLLRVAELLPPVEETGPNDLPNNQAVDPQEFARLMSEAMPEGEPSEPTPGQTPEEFAEAAIQAAG